MSDTTLHQGKLLVALAVVLALVSITLAPTVITDKEYWKPVPVVFMLFCSVHLALGSDYARQFIAGYLTLFGTIRVFGFVFSLVFAGPVARNVLPTFGATLGLVAAGILFFSKPLQQYLRVRYEARTLRHTILLRVAWILFLIYCAVIVYLDFTRTT
jgi:hypothetical protein